MERVKSEKRYFLHSDSYMCYDYLGKELGQSGERAIYKCRGSHKYYRNSFPTPENKTMKLWVLKTTRKLKEIQTFLKQEIYENFDICELLDDGTFKKVETAHD